MPGHDIIVIGASAGGVEALSKLVRNLPKDLGAAVFVVLHISPHGMSYLPEILSRNGPLPARHPADREVLRPGMIYVCPPDHHMLVFGDRIVLSRGPKENGHRPAVDPLFRSAAKSFGPRVAGVVLSGTLDDGTAGLAAIKQMGGAALVQDPTEALYAGMPGSALEHVAVDHCLPIAELARTLVAMARSSGETWEDPPVPEDLEREVEIAAFELAAIDAPDHPGKPAGFGCPDCGGSLWELSDGDLIRFRCRVGHAWSAQSLLAEQSEVLEQALWSALRALEERASLSTRLAERLRSHGNSRSADRFNKQEQELKERAALIRQILLLGREPAEGGASLDGPTLAEGAGA